MEGSFGLSKEVVGVQVIIRRGEEAQRHGRAWRPGANYQCWCLLAFKANLRWDTSWSRVEKDVDGKGTGYGIVATEKIDGRVEYALREPFWRFDGCR